MLHRSGRAVSAAGKGSGGKRGNAAKPGAAGRRSESDGSARTVSGGAGLRDYTAYTLGARERLLSIALFAGVLFAVGMLFYKLWFLALLLTLPALKAPGIWRTNRIKRQRTLLKLHFKQALYSLSSSMSAGRSVENAFREAAKDLELLYPGGNSDMIRELNVISTRLEYGEPIEAALLDFGRRSQIDDIDNFIDVFVTCKRTGGDLIEVVRRTSTVIGEKMEIQQDISVMIAQKKFESNILLGTPFIFIVFINASAPEFMAPLYGSAAGIALATVGLALIFLSAWLMNRITNIQI
ncbi:type II secretion system F family protein [Saccharibacillus sp. CPCC 101409]|uniref:type II secretion system F family protein n=1 Tax=Saccharibacillus sp. CPCC 101409 TaxID=3058041 RepID=UPI00267138EE|nr:type II secretion system F family protein [Saccharibacillus sp. CPCC 101409]MDO3408632.1 type II secretion system F family protein [Saccharibacillus sp. CPCC 101409]